MKRTIITIMVTILVLAMLLSSCTQTPSEQPEQTPAPVADAAQDQNAPNNDNSAKSLVEIYGGIGYDPIYVEASDFDIGTSSKPLNIAVAAGTVGSGFFKIIVDMMTEVMEANNAKVLLADANNSFETQTNQIENFITQKVDGMIVNSCDPPSTISEVLQKAAEANIPVIAVDSALDSNFHNYLGMVGSDNYNLGFGVGQYIGNEFVKANGSLDCTVAVLDGVEGNAVAKARYDGFWDGIKSVDPNANIEEVSHLYGGSWTEEAGIKMAGDLFVAHPDVDIIFGISDPFVVGAVAEAERKSIEGVTMGAVDGAKSAMKIIFDGGVVKAIGLNDPIRMGRAAASAMLSYLNTGYVPSSKMMMLNPITATPENINELYDPDSPF